MHWLLYCEMMGLDLDLPLPFWMKYWMYDEPTEWHKDANLDLYLLNHQNYFYFLNVVVDVAAAVEKMKKSQCQILKVTIVHLELQGMVYDNDVNVNHMDHYCEHRFHCHCHFLHYHFYHTFLL